MLADPPRLTWPLHLVLGWGLAGLCNVALALWDAPAAPSMAAALASHAVDLGRHVAFGLASAAAVYSTRRWLPGRPWLVWLAFAAVSIGLAAALLPMDLDELSERIADAGPLPASLVSAAIVLAVGGALPAVAWLTRQRAFGTRRIGQWLGVLRVVGALGLALVAVGLNVGTSPSTNPSAHLFLSWLTAVCLGHALPRIELSPEPGLRARVFAFGLAALAGWGLWALFGPHSNSVMIQIARRPSSLHLAALLNSDGGLDTVQAALAARAGPFFRERESLPAVPPTPGPRPPGPPIVIFLSIDSLRADVPTHPEHGKYMPNLTRLMAEGVTFANARAPGSMTKYTISSVSSGKYFSQQYWTKRGKSRWPIEDESVHLATALSEAGIFTAAFPSVRWFLNRLGLVEGFQASDWQGDPMPGRQSSWMKGESLTRLLIEQLGRESSRAGFYWLHYLDSHSPFNVGGKGGSKFTRYLRSLRVVDGFVGEVCAAIDRLGIADRVLLFVTSDHGEAFGEHGSTFHGGTLYDELVRVPLVARGPGLVPREVDTPVSLIDVGPTILDWFGVPTPPSFMGESLVPFLLGGSRSFSRPIVSETGLKQAMLFGNGRKVIRDLRQNTLELYDLTLDPGELVNLSDSIDPDEDEHVLLLRSFFQMHTYRKNGYRVPYVK